MAKKPEDSPRPVVKHKDMDNDVSYKPCHRCAQKGYKDCNKQSIHRGHACNNCKAKMDEDPRAKKLECLANAGRAINDKAAASAVGRKGNSSAQQQRRPRPSGHYQRHQFRPHMTNHGMVPYPSMQMMQSQAPMHAMHPQAPHTMYPQAPMHTMYPPIPMYPQAPMPPPMALPMQEPTHQYQTSDNEQVRNLKAQVEKMQQEMRQLRDTHRRPNEAGQSGPDPTPDSPPTGLHITNGSPELAANPDDAPKHPRDRAPTPIEIETSRLGGDEPDLAHENARLDHAQPKFDIWL